MFVSCHVQQLVGRIANRVLCGYLLSRWLFAQEKEAWKRESVTMHHEDSNKFLGQGEHLVSIMRIAFSPKQLLRARCTRSPKNVDSLREFNAKARAHLVQFHPISSERTKNKTARNKLLYRKVQSTNIGRHEERKILFFLISLLVTLSL